MRTTRGHQAWLVLAGAAILGYQLIPLLAQSPTTPASITDISSYPSFEVASVKRNHSGGGGISLGTQAGGRFIARNVTLRQLITYAYRIQPFQLAGGPDWLGTQRFDITATPEGAVSPTPPGVTTTIHLMTRRLLAERFALVVHEEEREMPVYVLTFAREDKRLGPGLRPSTFDCEAHRKAGASDLNLPPSPGGRPVCGMQLASDSLPSIFTALSEQFGLKLESQRAPVKVLVINRVQEPTED